MGGPGMGLGCPRLYTGCLPGARLSLNPKFIIFTRGSPSPSTPPMSPMGWLRAAKGGGGVACRVAPGYAGLGWVALGWLRVARRPAPPLYVVHALGGSGWHWVARPILMWLWVARYSPVWLCAALCGYGWLCPGWRVASFAGALGETVGYPVGYAGSLWVASGIP